MDEIIQIKAMRKFHNLTQEQFAKKLGFSRSVISDVESMRRKPSANLLLAISRNFERTDEFFSFRHFY